MKRIEFHDREEEIKEIKSILEREPSLITFIYGPINSGKTELMSYVVKQLPKDYAIFRINLGGGSSGVMRNSSTFFLILTRRGQKVMPGNMRKRY